jgi:transposase
MKNNAISLAVLPVATLSCDVGMDRITMLCSSLVRPGVAANWDIENRSVPIRSTLLDIQRRVLEAGFSGLRVIVEPTGIYQILLLRIARQLGCQTGLVSAAHVVKMREVVFGDRGKTDRRDPYVIDAVANQGRLIVDRNLPEAFQLLRQWTNLYATSEHAIIETKSKIHRVMKLLFPDFAFTSSLLYGDSGRSSFRCYGFDPNRIAQQQPARMLERLRKTSRILRPSIARLLMQARASANSAPQGRVAELLGHELAMVWEELELHERRRADARDSLDRLYDEARLLDPRLPEAAKGVMSKTALARLIGELGPLSDFTSWHQLLKMAGMNLCERKSGKYAGQTKISRSGRSGARAILNQMALPLVKRDRLFGPYYHHKIGVEKMPGKKAMTAVARKLMKLIWGLYQSENAFDRSRVFVCSSQHELAA